MLSVVKQTLDNFPIEYFYLSLSFSLHTVWCHSQTHYQIELPFLLILRFIFRLTTFILRYLCDWFSTYKQRANTRTTRMSTLFEMEKQLNMKMHILFMYAWNFGWHARKRFDVVICLTFFSLDFPLSLSPKQKSPCVRCTADQYPSIKKKVSEFSTVFFSYVCALCAQNSLKGGSLPMGWCRVRVCHSTYHTQSRKKGLLFLHKTSVRTHKNYYFRKKIEKKREVTTTTAASLVR